MRIRKEIQKVKKMLVPPPIVTLKEEPTISPIKSVRVFVKDGMVHINYYLNELYIVNGKNRLRFSTGVTATKENIAHIEKEKDTLAFEHYNSKHNVVVENKVKLKDIAYDALNENKHNRTKYVHDDYETILENYILRSLGDRVLSEIKKSDIVKWQTDLLTKLSLSKSRYSKYHRTLGFIFNYAYQNEYIDKNPFALVSKQSKLFTVSTKDNSKKYYTKSEVQQMIDEASGWFKVYLITVLYTGIRSGESLALQWGDVDYDKETITIERSIRRGLLKNTTKTNTIRVVDMPKPVKDALLVMQQNPISELWIFPNPETKLPFYEPAPITHSYLKPLLQRLGIEYKTLYACRHSFASICVANNIPLTYVQRQLGHSKLSTTMDFYVKNGLIDAQSRDERIDRLFA